MTTTSTIALAELAEKGADVDVLPQMVQLMAQRLMEMDVEGPLRRQLRREKRRENEQPQWLRRTNLGDARWRRRAANTEAEPGQLLPGFPIAPPDSREGPDGSNPGGLYQGHLDPLLGRSDQGNGQERRVQEPGLAAVQKTRRASRAFSIGLSKAALVVLWIDAAYVKTREAGRIVRVAVGGNTKGQCEVLGVKVGSMKPSRFERSSCAA